ncbi:carboxypeptidase-like regulatory domain-containing protein [Mucilaginibacter segetis]|uniref:Carboxypeptidase-like regulatory domain-containing protein n=1 Tax=Mucilaginibacter segetis TaxID=2793071 RepID=A0A934PTV5_9SPHI|nr:carboxypeptidase-like regulatory domain-containing protein [Mucilaginibacter segetis]MBK0380734.1 carboxypeptidase-like regulatory domain-containing protein [Mucilaginibacter segetis]
MKYLLFVALSILFFNAGAQDITGNVTDRSTGRPLPYILISGGKSAVYSDADGHFSLPPNTDTISISTMGYKPYKHAISKITRKISVQLEPGSIELNEVHIMAKKNFFKDSLNTRREFERTFNYQPTRFSDIFRPTSTNVPFAFVTVDVFKIIDLLNRKNDPQLKLKKQLLKDERENHINQRFNKSMISNVSQLKGDSLETFLVRYRPSVQQIDHLSDYELIQYVKEKTEEFRADNNSGGTALILH